MTDKDMKQQPDANKTVEDARKASQAQRKLDPESRAGEDYKAEEDVETGTVPELGKTVEHTLSDVIENQQAEAAGQEVPNPELPEFPDARIDPETHMPRYQRGDLGQRAGRPDEPVRSAQLPAHSGPPLTPERLREKHPGEHVKMNFPQDTHLTMDDRTTARFPAGHHDVPEHLADHPYLKASGVTRVEDPPHAHIPPTQEGREKGTPRKS